MGSTKATDPSHSSSPPLAGNERWISMGRSVPGPDSCNAALVSQAFHALMICLASDMPFESIAIAVLYSFLRMLAAPKLFIRMHRRKLWYTCALSIMLTHYFKTTVGKLMVFLSRERELPLARRWREEDQSGIRILCRSIIIMLHDAKDQKACSLHPPSCASRFRE